MRGTSRSGRFVPYFFNTDMSAYACMSACMFIEKIKKFGIEKKLLNFDKFIKFYIHEKVH